MAPRVGLEPTTYRLTAGRSTIELSGNKSFYYLIIVVNIFSFVNIFFVFKSLTVCVFSTTNADHKPFIPINYLIFSSGAYFHQGLDAHHRARNYSHVPAFAHEPRARACCRGVDDRYPDEPVAPRDHLARYQG